MNQSTVSRRGVVGPIFSQKRAEISNFEVAYCRTDGACCGKAERRGDVGAAPKQNIEHAQQVKILSAIARRVVI